MRPIALALLAAGLLAALVFWRIDVRADMADFLPAGQTPAARLMLAQLRSGSAASLILIGIEGAPAPELARISRVVTETLARDAQFAVVQNGAQSLGAAEQDFLFAHRYLLSPATTPAAFATEALRADLERLLRGLESAAAPLVARYGLADPPGAFLALAQAWIGGSPIRTQDGVWFAADRPRALILAKTTADGMDVLAQDAVAQAIGDAFRQAKPGAARLLEAGAPVFARESARAIRADVRRISILSTVLIVGLLLWRFRSPWAVAAIAVPVLVSVAAAALAVQLAFGFVHGAALGFGLTMLGVTIDYPVLLIGHRKRGEAAAATLRRIGPALALAVTTAALGLTSMLLSGFPGLAQLGLFSVVGLVTAALATWLVLPRLVVAANLAPVSAGDPATLLRCERLRDWRLWGLLPVAVAALALLVHGLHLEADLSRLSPVPRAAQDQFAALSREVGTPDVGQLVIVTGDSAEAVLTQEEHLAPALEALTRQGALAGWQAAAQLLPSAATQLARRAALPDPATLVARLTAARAGLPYRPTAFDAFRDNVAAERVMPPVTRAAITSRLIAARLDPLLFRRDGAWWGAIAPQGVTDAGAIRRAVAGVPGVVYLDMKAETDGIVAVVTTRAWRWVAVGAAAALVALGFGLRDVISVVRVVGAVAAAVLLTVALLTALGERLTLIHLVSLQLVAGVGLDYALFFARRQLDAEERARTLRTLVTCNAMTLLSFGLLALCRTPLLRDIGATVAIGALMAIACGFLFVGPRAAEPA